MLNVIYRFSKKENSRPRARFYNKVVCLMSLVEALTRNERSKFILLSDGEPPESIAQQLPRGAETVRLEDPGLIGSLLTALRLACEAPRGEWVYFVEDDYMHLPESTSKLMDVLRARVADYVTLYDDPLRYWLSEDVTPDLPLLSPDMFCVGNHHWRGIESTTYTFAGGVETIMQDRKVFESHIANLSADRGYLADRQAWRDLQKLEPGSRSPAARRLVGAVPSLATHCDSTSVSPVVDWDQAVSDLLRRRASAL